MYGEFYTEHYIKEEADEKGDTIKRIIPAQRAIHSILKKVNLICIRENGGYCSTDSLKYCASVIHNELHIPFNYHSITHTHATMLVEAGVNIKSGQERLGRTNITTTLQTYTKNTPTMEKNLVDVFEQMINLILPTSEI